MRSAEYAQKLTEAQLLEKVVALAEAKGWKVHHCRPARTERGWRTPITGHAGFPDLVLARDGWVIFAELKSESGRLTKQQREWIDQLANPDAPTHAVEVWRPTDWPEIEEALA